MSSSDIIEEYVLHLDENITKVDALCKDMKTLATEMRNLKKRNAKLIKLAQKTKRRREDQKEPSGFTSPVEISDELAVFLNLEKGSSLPRSQVTKLIFEYVKDHNLKDPNDGRRFNLEDSSNVYAKDLKRLLCTGDNEEVGYFTLQKHLKKHFKSQPQVLISPVVIADDKCIKVGGCDNGGDQECDGTIYEDCSISNAIDDSAASVNEEGSPKSKKKVSIKKKSSSVPATVQA